MLIFYLRSTGPCQPPDENLSTRLLVLILVIKSHGKKKIRYFYIFSTAYSQFSHGSGGLNQIRIRLKKNAPEKKIPGSGSSAR